MFFQISFQKIKEVSSKGERFWTILCWCKKQFIQVAIEKRKGW